jgi:tetratricopeptide (TPR) repeat protein
LVKRFYAEKSYSLGRHAAFSRDGGVLAVLNNDQAVVQLADPAGSKPLRELARMPDVDRVAVSPDGRWVAAAAVPYHASGVRVWSVDGTPALEVPWHAFVAFSPDGRWLASATRDEVHLYRVGSWERPYKFQRDEVDPMSFAPLAFQPGRGLLAAVTSRQHVRLYDPESGQAVATLTHPEPANADWVSFSPDGTRLAVTRAQQEVAVWDLTQVRDGLVELGLDPGPLPESSSRQHAPATEITVDRGTALPPPSLAFTRWRNIAIQEAGLGKFVVAIKDANYALAVAPPDHNLRARLLIERGEYHWRNGGSIPARDDWQAALELAPESADAAVWLARLLLLGPPEVRNPQRAFGLLAPFAGQDGRTPAVTLYAGIAQVRRGRYRDGLETLNRVAAEEGGSVRDYFRAVALSHLGDKAAAQEAWNAARAADERAAERRDAEKAELARVRGEFEPVVNRPADR